SLEIDKEVFHDKKDSPPIKKNQPLLSPLKNIVFFTNLA
ncbi:MAG: hypothetical protein ACI9S8_001617, partial [Chlamydiales bacterium]